MPVVAIIVLAAIVLALLAFLIWDNYRSQGKMVSSSSLSADEIADEIVGRFVTDGWKLEHRADDYFIMDRGPRGLTGLILLIVFFPLGLVYLFTDWGHAKMGVAFREGQRGATEFQITWRNAGIRGQLRRLLELMEAEPVPAGKSA